MKYNISEISGIIKDRRNVTPENFSEREIHPEIINNMLNAAIWAPSHGKTQPWRFNIYQGQGKDQVKTLLTQAYKDLTPEAVFQSGKQDRIAQRVDKSSAVMLVHMARQEEEKIPEIEEIISTGIAVQNLNLVATAYGIASFWASPKFIYHKEFNARLGLKEKDICVAVLYLGYVSAENWPKGQRRPIEYVSEWHK